MASAKKEIRFNEYLDFILETASSRGLGKTELMGKCAIPRQRWSEFDKGRSVTGRYFLKFMEGLNLTIDDIEKKSRKKMSPEQKRELQVESWQSAHRSLIEAMVDNPGLLHILEAAIKAQKK
jgi:hypothetical protein